MTTYLLSELPKHIQFAIAHEAKCIELRRRQIESYEKKIELFMNGAKPSDVREACPPIFGDIVFNHQEYGRLKRQSLNINRQGGRATKVGKQSTDK